MVAKPLPNTVLTLPVKCFTFLLLGGTVFLLLFALTRDIDIAIAACIYIIIAVVVNIIVLLLQVASSFTYKEHQIVILWHTALLLLNIPVAILYAYVVFYVILS